MHLHNRYLPKPSASSPPDNRAPPMANTSQAPDLEGLHCEIHGMAEQMRIMNENNTRLVQLLAAANPPPPVAPPIPDMERSHHSNSSGGRSQNLSTYRARRRRCRSPSSPRRERSSSLESSEVPAVGGEYMGRGRSPRRGDRIEARDKSTSQKIRDLDARLNAINTEMNALVTVDTLIRQTEPPFIERVLRAQVSSKFKLPTQLGIYEGKTNPMDHLDSYKSLMLLQGCLDEVMCKVFSATLKGLGRSWFQKLPPGTIDSFGDLSRLFVANFMSCRNQQKNASHLFTVYQKETESLKDFVKQFNQTVLEVKDPSDKVVIMAMMEGFRPGEPPYSMVFGTESVIPVEIGMPSFRTSNFDKESNEIELRLNLDLLDEKREMDELHQAADKCQVTLSTKEPSAGKLSPTWEGPYKVIKVSRPETYWLEDPSGKALSHLWNAEHLKKYYQ
ncbi:hypothetical protein Acr_00g0070490 [Actinidia rufa]|uniref:Retrotransposon gag domain-containing protein n=1 Tax=Actinidia rufa TaxID=165716 RepID=A0A7J0DR77_9ERIC|nr:hypothetical protein Acr_00g0070490 [Actinidia rufa]